MRKALFALTAVAMLAATGCHYNLAKNGCSDCGGGHAGGGHHGGALAGGGLAGGLGGGGYAGAHGAPQFVAPVPHGAVNQLNNPGNGGPPSPTVGYPYYSVRAPRDFLAPNPPSIGY